MSADKKSLHHHIDEDEDRHALREGAKRNTNLPLLLGVGFFGTLGTFMYFSKQSNPTVRFGQARVWTQGLFVAGLCGLAINAAFTSKKDEKHLNARRRADY